MDAPMIVVSGATRASLRLERTDRSGLKGLGPLVSVALTVHGGKPGIAPDFTEWQ
jgi:hypothetical protein